MQEQVVKMYIHASLVPTFPSDDKRSCSCQSFPLVTLVGLPENCLQVHFL
ncbi:hypothetical protein MtrunA17_Chr7g0274051 [Medicago truncatula]|uniref:Uncharacterized protein n=1 Tax=Medicago truncatula TaxID=3880 RepID=A0A396HDN3_MEDTR|nr:hypothetical protein MtrunA17_Chr7g0274051 [Medicago truncatula]